MKDLKYLLAYTVPLSAYVSFESTGIWTYSAVFYAFIVLPILDVLAGESATNLDSDAADEKNRMWMFDLMLYANVPLVFGLMAYFFVQLQSHTYATFELVGLLLSAGILLATNAINVAHELGHRASLPERLMSKLLYMPCLYMHFFIEHNFGHHMNVATPEDGATARYNQTVYGFWWTSVTKQYLSAWRLQAQLLKRQQLSFLSPKNDMLWYHLIQPAYLGAVWFLFSWEIMLCALGAGVISFLVSREHQLHRTLRFVAPKTRLRPLRARATPPLVEFQLAHWPNRVVRIDPPQRSPLQVGEEVPGVEQPRRKPHAAVGVSGVHFVELGPAALVCRDEPTRACPNETPTGP